MLQNNLKTAGIFWKMDRHDKIALTGQKTLQHEKNEIQVLKTQQSLVYNSIL